MRDVVRHGPNVDGPCLSKIAKVDFGELTVLMPRITAAS
jgi:hypothetical protein